MPGDTEAKLPKGARRLPSGRVQVRYTDDRGVRRSKTFTRVREAERWLERTRTDVERGDWINPADGRRIVRAVAEQWIETRVLRPKTAAAYDSILRLRIYPTFGATPVAHVTALDLQLWVAEMTRSGLAPGTVHNAFVIMRGILDAAVRAGYLRANPARVLDKRDLPKVHQREMHFLTAQQVRDLAAALPSPYGLMAQFAAVTGARAGEVNGLRWEHVDLLRGRVKIAESISRVGTTHHINPPKNGQARTVPMTKALTDALRAYATTHPDFAPESYVWPDPGDPRAALAYSRDFYLPLWRPATNAAGLPGDLRFHDLRHTCAALLIAANVPAKAIQVHLGHKSFKITMDVYGHLYADSEDMVASALDAQFG